MIDLGDELDADKKAMLERLVIVIYWGFCIGAVGFFGLMLLIASVEGAGALIVGLIFTPLIYGVGWAIRYVVFGTKDMSL